MSENTVVNGGKNVKLTQYNEKLTYLDLGAGNGFLDIRAAGTVEPTRTITRGRYRTDTRL